MLLTEFFNNPEGDSYAKSKTTTPTAESKFSSTQNRNMVGTKTTGNKKVSKYVAEDQWSGENNAWSDGKGQWYDGVDQWHGDDNGMFSGSGGGGASSGGADGADKGGTAEPTSSVVEPTISKEPSADVEELDEDANPADTVTLDIPLVIRMLEYAREDAKTDLELHKVTERMIALSKKGRTLTMDDYNKICSIKE